MTYNDIYLLSDEGIRGALNVSSDSSIKQISDPYAILRHEFIPENPIVWKRNTGSKQKDCISTSWAVLNLFSDRVFNLFDKFCFTGWDKYQCVVYGKNNELISGYKGYREKSSYKSDGLPTIDIFYKDNKHNYKVHIDVNQ